MNKKSSSRAFTLIELLVVIGLIVVLAGGIGLAFSGGDKANALHGAQGTLQSLVSATRGQAALAGKQAALFVNVDSTADRFDTQRYLRSFVVARRNDDDTQWVVVGDEITLPSGIYLVPPSAVGKISSIDPDYKKTKDISIASVIPLKYSDSGAADFPGDYAMVVMLDARGTKPDTGVGSTSQLVLSPAEVDAATASDLKLKFTQPNLVRGAIISKYGVLTPINDESGFEN